MRLFSPIIVATFVFFITFSLLFFIFKIAPIISTIKLLYKSKKDIKYFLTNLAKSFYRYSDRRNESNRRREKETKEFTEDKPSFNKNYKKKKDYKNFKRIK